MLCDNNGGAGFLPLSMMLLRFPYCYTGCGMSPEALVWSDWCYKEAGLRGGLLATGARSEDTEKHQSFLLSSSHVPVPGEWPFYPTPQAYAAMLPFSIG